MCCCGKPVINDQMGYKWQPNDAPSVRGTHAPELAEGDELLYDLPGRCGRGLDSHSYHFRIVKQRGGLYILVQHGGGQERQRFGWFRTLGPTLAAMDSEGLYWMCQAAHHSTSDAADQARDNERARWQAAAAEKRIKTRKYPARGIVKVWIEDKQ